MFSLIFLYIVNILFVNIIIETIIVLLYIDIGNKKEYN